VLGGNSFEKEGCDTVIQDGIVRVFKDGKMVIRGGLYDGLYLVHKSWVVEGYRGANYPMGLIVEPQLMQHEGRSLWAKPPYSS
jgi:hypothetical protein